MSAVIGLWGSGTYRSLGAAVNQVPPPEDSVSCLSSPKMEIAVPAPRTTLYQELVRVSPDQWNKCSSSDSRSSTKYGTTSAKLFKIMMALSAASLIATLPRRSAMPLLTFSASA